MEIKKQPLLLRVTLLLFFIILLFHALVQAEDFFAPLSLGILFSYLLYPLVHFLEKKKFPKILAIITSIILFIIVISGVLFLIFKQVEGMMTDFPALKQQAFANVDELGIFIERYFGIQTEKQHLWLKESVAALFESGSNFLRTTFSATTNTLFRLAILPVLIFYLLYYRTHFYSFIIKVIPEAKRRKTENILRKISLMTQNYVTGVFLVVAILSVLNSLGLYIVGLKYSITFGIISAFFNFIPYFGTWIGASIPIIFALLTSSSINLVIGVIILFVIIQFTENNILTPNITGSYVQLNPFFTIMGIIVGGMIWGIVGMFVIIPLLASMKIIFQHFTPTRPYAFLMGLERVRRGTKRWNRIRKFFTGR